MKLLSIVADIASVLAIPGLILVYVQLVRFYEEVHEARKPKGVSENTVEFLEGRIGINLVPIAKLSYLPRKGDTVMLPGERGEDRGTYEVTDVCHIYVEPTEGTGPCPAELLKVSVYVKKK